MPRPKNKADLLELSDKNFRKLMDFVDELPPSDQETDFPAGTMNRNIRDVLTHLHHWHKMMIEWYQVGKKGEKPDIPAKGYTWKTLPDLNRKILEKYQDTSLSEAKKLVKQSHDQVMQVIKSHTDEELFTKKKYHWTGSTSLGAYLISSTSSHYDWAFKLIKKAKK